MVLVGIDPYPYGYESNDGYESNVFIIYTPF